MNQSSSVMKEMGKRTSEIGSIVDTINLIAERTNLLSLNASIEAARAGDAGVALPSSPKRSVTWPIARPRPRRTSGQLSGRCRRSPEKRSRLRPKTCESWTRATPSRKQARRAFVRFCQV